MRSTLMVVGLLVFLGVGAGSLQAANAPDTESSHPLFDRIDANHDGFIELREWEAWRARMRHHREEGGAGGAGGPGVNTHLTMETASHGGGSGAPGTTGAGPGPTTASAPLPPVHPNGNPGNHEDRHPLFDRIDTNHDGRISLEEWIAWWTAHPRGHKKPTHAP